MALKHSTKGIRAHFIPNTHLDREWTMDFQHTRELTVGFLDNLIDIMQKIPKYHFLLDSQTVPLEDYFEIRPEKEPIMKKFIQEGRLNIGPWYTAPDMNCIYGESITRNLLFGHKMAAKYGPVMKVGYTPFGFVHISQLPQIYKSFGIDVCFFYRGINFKEASGAEFFWESPDGTAILSSSLSKKPRYNFYFDVWRQVYYSGLEYRLNRCYNWNDGQVPFKFCDEENRFEHGYILKPYRKFNAKKLPLTLRKLINLEKKTFLTSEIAFMHGMDTSTPDIKEDEILKKSQRYLKKDESFFYSSMPYYAECLMKSVKELNLQKLKGEMKFPPMGSKTTYGDIISIRPKQKILSAKAENILQRIAEPFSTISYLFDGKWPEKYLELAWKYLLKCHPHDTIGGCCIDRVEEDVTYRLNQTISLSKVILKESLGKIQVRIDNSDIRKEDILLTVFNPSPFSRTEIVTAYLDIPRELNMEDFAIYDDRNNKIDHNRTATKNIGKVCRDKTDLALYINTDEYKVNFLAEDIPAMGYKTFIVKKERSTFVKTKISKKFTLMENEYLIVGINGNGTLNITNKNTGLQYKGLHYFEDSGEAGHLWTHIKPEKDKVITSKKSKAQIQLVENSNLLACYKIQLRLMVPETTCYDEELKIHGAEYIKSRRSKVRNPIDIYSYITLRKGAKSLEIKTKVINTCENHRLRVMFPTHLKARISCAESAYDVVERVIDRDENHPFDGEQNPTHSFLRFVDLSDEKNGLSFISNGLREYEAIDNKERTLAITLIRAVEIRLCTTSVMDKVPGNLSQSLGENVFNYYIHLHEGDWASADVFKESERLNFPLMVCETGGGNGGKLPKHLSFFEMEGKNLILSALKKSDYNDSTIIRVFNPTKKDLVGKVKFFKRIKSANFVNMNEEKIKTKRVKFKGKEIFLIVPPKKVITLSVLLVAGTTMFEKKK